MTQNQRGVSILYPTNTRTIENKPFQNTIERKQSLAYIGKQRTKGKMPRSKNTNEIAQAIVFISSFHLHSPWSPS